MDIDFKTEKKIELNLQTCYDFGKHIAERIGKNVKFLIVAKDKGYFKEVNNKNVYATGFHIYYPDT